MERWTDRLTRSTRFLVSPVVPLRFGLPNVPREYSQKISLGYPTSISQARLVLYTKSVVANWCRQVYVHHIKWYKGNCSNVHYWNQREYIGPPTHGRRFKESSSSVVRPSREAIDPRIYKQETEDTSYLTPPDLTHDSETTRSIIRPETRIVVAQESRTRGRFHPNKRSSETQSLITELCENDIVCGRGAPTRFHKGNIQFQNLILQYQSTYLFSKRPDKPRLAWALLEIIQSNGGRFFRRVKGKGSKSSKPTNENTSCFGWEQLNERQAYEKICQSLREGAPELRRKILSGSSTSELENQI